MKVVKYESEAWALQNTDEGLLDVFQRYCLRIVLCAWLTDRISNSRLYEKFGSTPFSTKIMKERMVMARSADEGWQIPEDCPYGQPYRAKWKAGHRRLGWEDLAKKDLKEIGSSWEDIKREALITLGWRRSVRSCIGLRRLGARIVSSVVSELLASC